MIKVKDLFVNYRSGGKNITVLSDISLEVNSGEVVAIVGPSGSGKSTLLGMIAGLDKPHSGTITINGQSLEDLNEDDLALFRRDQVGIIFQSFHLIPTLTALENVMVPLEMSKNLDAAERGKNLLEVVGLKERMDHYPGQLSGGEQQRVAVARAFANRPLILLADEPTGNLDSSTGNLVIDQLVQLHRDFGTTLLLATHDPVLAGKAKRVVTLKDGKLVTDRQI
ncbi:MAG TPA: ABC transporter ATP-binding protein [Nitrospiria bacterium]